MYQSKIMAALDALSPDDHLDAADARTLSALAAFFDAQAARFRAAADTAHRREHNAQAARRSRERAKAEWLRHGARLAVLARRMGRGAAVVTMMERTGLSAEQLDKARATWNRTKIERKLHTRNVAIYKAKLAGDGSRALAARYGLTTRQVDKITAEMDAALTRFV